MNSEQFENWDHDLLLDPERATGLWQLGPWLDLMAHHTARPEGFFSFWPFGGGRSE